MSRVITFSRTYPAYHPKKGEPTFFVEKLLSAFDTLVKKNIHNINDLEELGLFDFVQYLDCAPKYHTIREGDKWKVGDIFSPRVWGTDINPKSGRSGAYHSKQIIISGDVEIKQLYKFEVKKASYHLNGKKAVIKQLQEIAKNDGLTLDDLELWFNKPFIGQIICWSDQVKY